MYTVLGKLTLDEAFETRNSLLLSKDDTSNTVSDVYRFLNNLVFGHHFIRICLRLST